MTADCVVDAPSLEELLSLVEARDPAAVRAAAALGSPAGPELALASALAIEGRRERRGTFIVVTGIDRSGKETHVFNPRHVGGVRPLVDFMRDLGYDAMGIRQPEYDLLSGQLIRSYLGAEGSCRISGHLSRDVAWILWSLNRALLNAPAALWLSGEGRALVSKRWSESNVAYHAAQGVSPDRILSLEGRFIQPDLFLVLDVDPEVSARRMEGDADTFESRLGLLSAARAVLMDLGKYFPGSAVVRVDASREPGAVNRELQQAIRDFLRRRS